MQSDIEGFLMYLATERGLSENYQLSTQRSLEAFAEWLGSTHGIDSVEKVTLPLVSAYLTSRKSQGAAASSIKLIVVALKVFFRWLHQRKRLPTDLTEVLPLPRIERYLPETLHQPQILRLLESLPPEGPLAARNRAIFELLYACGLRVSELCGARLENLDLQTHILRVTGKGDKMRLLPVGSKAIEALQLYLDKERPELVRKHTRSHLFLSVRGRMLTPDRIWQLVKEASRQAGFGETVYPHLLRHSFATHLLQNGADLRIIQELLGHADIATTQIYTHVEQTQLKAIHRTFHPRA